MSRCKCCNNTLTKHEIIWYEDIKQHEEFCSNCRTLEDLDNEDIVDDIYLVSVREGYLEE